MRKFLDWDKVADRLRQYDSIRSHFPMDALQRCEVDGPFYCHPIAWRLGTWFDESCSLAHFDNLLANASSMENWQSESSLLSSSDFSEFWSLAWQLQIADYLKKIGSGARWLKCGPDLSATVDGDTWYVECYCYRKSFGLYFFIEELLTNIHPRLKVRHTPCLPLSLPQNKKREEFLDSVFCPFLADGYLESMLRKADNEYPVVLQEYENLCIYVDGGDSSEYVPGRVSSSVGSPKAYLQVLMKEISNAKATSNSLAEFRPNLVAINLLLSEDYQLAMNYLEDGHNPMPSEISESIDALTISCTGIDEFVTKESLEVVHSRLTKFGSLSSIAM